MAITTTRDLNPATDTILPTNAPGIGDRRTIIALRHHSVHNRATTGARRPATTTIVQDRGCLHRIARAMYTARPLPDME